MVRNAIKCVVPRRVLSRTSSPPVRLTRSFRHFSSWTSSGLFSTLHISTIASSSALSVGDALRELDGQKVRVLLLELGAWSERPSCSYTDTLLAEKIIKSDFVLLSGDVVSNLNLMEAVKAHRERRKVSKECIMTLVVKESATDTRHR